MKDFDIEKKKLSETIDIVEELLFEEKEELENLFNNFIGNVDELWRISNFKKIHIANLESSKDNPYFARIDFKTDNNEYSIYIGKNGIIKDSDIIVTDWRAPISSLYYDSNIGPCSYESPDGVINGEMSLKRQYEIEQGNLLSYFNVDLVSNDGLLQKYLNSNNDSRLKSIVSTIQQEQNNIIRKKLNENLIIQGVAGSGKTTVALHRIAYLVYNYINSIKQNQYLVIGPNPVFLKYIKSVLPELDVTGIEQSTFEEFAKNYINEDINIIPSDKKIVLSIAGKVNNDIDKFKCSIKYQNMLEIFLDMYFRSITSKDLEISGMTVLSSDIIKEYFENELNTQGSLNIKVERVIDKLCNLIENENEEIVFKYFDYSHDLFKEAKTQEERDKLKKLFNKDRQEIAKNCRNLLKKYFSKTKITPTKLYKLFISSINDYNVYNYNHLNQLKKDTLSNIKNNNYDFEDLAALLYIKYALNPNKDYEKIKHVVIDEAQDFGEFNFYVLKKILPSSTFSIFGDIAQSIYDYRGINNWDEVNNVMFNNNGQIINFTKSYRTTSEIMNVADDVADSIGLSRSDLVVRHGNEVSINHCDINKVPDYIINKIKEFKAKGYKTIAIISKTNLLSCYINDDLADKDLIIPNISNNDDLTDERYNICTISNQLSKGLEFDAVIINDASEDIYSSNSSLDMKLLYVAITRALHELDIVYTGELTKPLQKTLEKQLVLKK